MIPWLKERLVCTYGAEITEKIICGYHSVRPVTLRANSLKTTPVALEEALSVDGISFFRVPWYSHAFVVENAREEQLKKTAIYENGEIYLQSLSSMLPPLYSDPQAGESILDMTAAPGGKTTQLSALSGGKAFITACERDKIRADRLAYNVKKQSAPNVTVLTADAEKLDDFFRFDKILLDAPCSGSGTLQLSRPVRISEKLVENSVKLQERLLCKAWKLLKRGGTLVYSTCSVLPEENSGAVRKLLKREDAELVPLTAFEDLPLLPGDDGTVTVCPNALYEGFFIAKLKKR